MPTNSTAKTAKKAAKKAAKKVAVKLVEETPATKKAKAPAKKSADQKIADLEAMIAQLRGELTTTVAAKPTVELETEVTNSTKKAAKKSTRKTASTTEITAPEPQVAELTAVVPEPVAPVTVEQNEAAVANTTVTATHHRKEATTEIGENTSSSDGRISRRQRWKDKRMREKEERRKRRESRDAGSAGSESLPEAKEGEEGGFQRTTPVLLGPPEPCAGILELTPKGYGFLRTKDTLWAPLNTDCWVSGDLIRKYGMREGVAIKGEQCAGPRGPQLTQVFEISGIPPEQIRDLPLFEELKAVNPNKRYQLEGPKDRVTTRVLDMMTPIGRGQRGLIVAPPRAGKTTLLQHIAEAMTQNYPQVHLMILLVDERPEEVTEFRRVLPNAEIFASNNDQDLKSHVRIAQFAIERAKRLVEAGQHVFLLMDSITRLARAFNNSHKGGATGSGGLAVGSMEIPRRLFAAARNTRTAGSLTILATALVETGSRMDDIIFLEFKGTGNMELVLDRKIAEQYIYPAVNIFRSGTRREELLLPPFQLEKIHLLRRGLGGHKPIEAAQRVISLSERYPNNAQMLMELPSK